MLEVEEWKEQMETLEIERKRGKEDREARRGVGWKY